MYCCRVMSCGPVRSVQIYTLMTKSYRHNFPACIDMLVLLSEVLEIDDNMWIMYCWYRTYPRSTKVYDSALELEPVRFGERFTAAGSVC